MTMQRLTQPDWCNDLQPGNWQNACMRSPGHDGSHAVRKSYRLHEAMAWDGGTVRSTDAAQFLDLWSPDEPNRIYERASGRVGVPETAEYRDQRDEWEHTT